jgi:uncharacterized LabA/DUF88 family protein
MCFLSNRIRVALFFDGKNHMKDMRRAVGGRWADHGALARWAVEFVGGTEMTAAHYYTGVPSTTSDEPHARRALVDLLRDLERHPGFFVHRFPRHVSSWQCSACGQAESFTREKQVDTSLVADIVLHAARGNFDVAVVFSGDQDVVPAIDAVHALGGKAWVATFGKAGMSHTLERAAWGIIDLTEHVDHFLHPEIRVTEEPEADPHSVDGEVLRELRRAHAHFVAGGGFVGAHYFLHRWRGHGLPDDPEARRLSIERLIAAGSVEKYEVDHKAALRVSEDAMHAEE